MTDLVIGFEDDFIGPPGTAARMIRELREGSDAQFADAVRRLHEIQDPYARNRLLRLLMTDDRTLIRLTHPGVLPLNDAVNLAARMVALDVNLEVRLIRLLMPQSESGIRDPWHASRILEVVAAVSSCIRIQPLLPTLLRHPEVRVRSKVALILGRLNQNVQWLEDRLAEADPRVRANAVESMWGAGSQQARNLFRLAAEDEHQRVVANAAIGLHRAGDLEATRIVQRMAAAHDARFRASGLWAMGESQDPRFLPMLAEIVACRENGAIRQNALRSTVRIRSRLAQLQQRDRLRIHACWQRDRLEVWVRSADGKPLVDLPPTAFVVCDQHGALDVRCVRSGEPGEMPEHYELALAGLPHDGVRVGVYWDQWMGEQPAGESPA